jgi:chloramphenicol-sensitive protein RarD
VLGEPFGPGRMAGFACTWVALVIYTLDGWRVSRRASPAPI